MADNECISQLIEVERRAQMMSTFCEMVDEVAGDQPPAWLVVVWGMVKDLDVQIAGLGRHVRGGR